MPSLGATYRPEANLGDQSFCETYPGPNLANDSGLLARSGCCANCCCHHEGHRMRLTSLGAADTLADDLISRPLLLNCKLKQRQQISRFGGHNYHNQMSSTTTATNNNNNNNNNNNYSATSGYQSFASDASDCSKRSALCGSRFRFLIASIILFAITMNTYANYTMYIAAIKMVSNDVLASGMTELRAKHLSQDPLAAGVDAATPGTCPIETTNFEAISQLRQLAGAYVSPKLQPLRSNNRSVVANNATSQLSGPTQSQQLRLNASLISRLEQQALAEDTSALFAIVNERIENGQLVDWSISERGLIFTAHTVGSILISLPIGRLGLKYGSKVMVSFCILIAAGRMLLLPLMAGQAPMWLFFVFEFTMGAPGACIGILAYPLAAAWLLPDEANFFVALAQFGSLIGNAATNFISTQLLAIKLDWSYCYYLPGCCLALIGVLWILLGADRPEMSRFVSREELQVLKGSLANQNKQNQEKQLHLNAPTTITANNNNNNNNNNQATAIDGSFLLISKQLCHCCPNCRPICPAAHYQRKPNWSIIFTCPTIWALICVNFAYHWNAKIATLWPTYFANNLHLDAPTIGILTGLKGVVALVAGSAFAFLTRKLAINRPFGITLTAYRRSNQVFATLILGVSVALMILWDCNVWANFASVMLTPLVSSFNAISHEQMPLDLSAEDSGLLVSVIRLLAIGDIPALPASSYILSYAPDALAGDRPTWRLVWLLGFIIKVCACVFFILVARSKPKSYTRLEPSGACQTIKQQQQC